MERIQVHEESPDGAYWHLSPFVKQHTPGCILLGGKVWPWEILNKINPPLHTGCRCQLVGLDEAHRLGLVGKDMTTDLMDAVSTAKAALKADEIVTEAITPDEWQEYLDEIRANGSRTTCSTWRKQSSRSSETTIWRSSG